MADPPPPPLHFVHNMVALATFALGFVLAIVNIMLFVYLFPALGSQRECGSDGIWTLYCYFGSHISNTCKYTKLKPMKCIIACSNHCLNRISFSSDNSKHIQRKGLE